MSDNGIKAILLLGLGGAFVAGILFFRPGFFANSSSLAALIGAEIMLIAVANYRKVFLPLVLATFLWAGAELPMHMAALQARWAVLGLGAAVGLTVYFKDRVHSFKTPHLIALFCMLAAFVSASTSAYPNEALLKAVSLSLLFLYAVAGVRTAVPVLTPERFFQMLLRGCEILTWLSAVLYVVLRIRFYGNSNSLGAIMAVALIPMLLWGFLSAESGPRRLRLNIELVLAWVLLLGSFSRASIAAAVVSSSLICLALRHYRLFAKGAVALLVLAACVVLLKPLDTEAPVTGEADSVASVYLYKGKQDEGFWGSRRGPWQDTLAVVREKPWFGSGFGTSSVTGDMTSLQYVAHHVSTWVIREHGNSYLAILEWTGLLGVLPFYALAALMAMNAGRVIVWLRRTQDVFSPAVPVAAIVVAGLCDAMFEDWLFAVGYHLCIFFWAMAFILVDLVPQQAVVYSPTLSIAQPDPYYVAVASGQ